jgi:rRNA maturation protein Nop10
MVCVPKLKKKNRITNLQTQILGRYNHTEECSSQTVPLGTKYLIPVSNRFSPLDKYEHQDKNLGTLKHMKYRSFKETRSDKISYMNQHQVTRNSDEQSIPTIVNCVICDNDYGKLDLK